MNVQESFLKDNRKISLSLLINTQSRLSVVQLKRGSISLDDVFQALSLVDSEMSRMETSFYANLLIESSLNYSGPGTYLMKSEIIGNDADFLEHIMTTITGYVKGEMLSNIEEFKRDIANFLKIQSGQSSPPTFCTTNITINTTNSTNNMIENKSKDNNNDTVSFDMNLNSPIVKIEIEKAEPMVKFLAQIRKVGIDLTFDQNVHDKVCHSFLLLIYSFFMMINYFYLGINLYFYGNSTS